MKIVIEYDSVWQTSFLDGDPDMPVSRKDNPRKFVATTGTRGEHPTPITDSTILGVLYRLIGDQRKLYQSHQSGSHFFYDVENKISWKTKKIVESTELLYLTNKSDDRCGKATWMGVISDENPWFFSEFAPLLWSVLFLNKNELLDYFNFTGPHIPNKTMTVDCRPKSLLKRIDEVTDIKSANGIPWKNVERLDAERNDLVKSLYAEMQKLEDHINKAEEKPPKTEKQRENFKNKYEGFEKKIIGYKRELDGLGTKDDWITIENKLNNVVDSIQSRFPGNEYWSNGVLYPYRFYAAALYIQAQRLRDSGYDCNFALNKKNEIQIQGFSKRGFNGVRDWLSPMTGGRKKSVGTPCQVQKQSGQLEINIAIDREESRRICSMIECAGVSSFYLGKKGLAYVSDIRV